MRPSRRGGRARWLGHWEGWGEGQSGCPHPQPTDPGGSPRAFDIRLRCESRCLRHLREVTTAPWPFPLRGQSED